MVDNTGKAGFSGAPALQAGGRWFEPRSQNDEQANGGYYSYTKYDDLGTEKNVNAVIEINNNNVKTSEKGRSIEIKFYNDEK